MWRRHDGVGPPQHRGASVPRKTGLLWGAGPGANGYGRCTRGPRLHPPIPTSAPPHAAALRRAPSELRPPIRGWRARAVSPPATTAARGAPPREHPVDRLLGLDPRAFLRFFAREPLPFWCLCFYVMIEYVRPQQVYPVIDFLPWGELSLALTILTFVASGIRPRKAQILDTGMVVFSVVVVASSLTAFMPAVARENWSLYLSWVLLYVLTSFIVTTPRRFFIFLALFFLWSLKMSQHGARTLAMRGFAFADWGANGGPGWFQNSGEFAIQMCIFLPMSFHFMVSLRDRLPRWAFWGGMALLPGTAALSIVATSSRGGQLAAAVVTLFLIGQFPKRRVKGFAAVAIMLALLWTLIPPEQKQRFTEMGEDDTSQSRLTYWRHGLEIMREHPLLGVGYKNWGPYYVRYYNPEGEVSHNIFIEAGSEMGYLGLAAFVFLIVGTFVLNWRTRRLSRRIPRWEPFLRSAALGLDAALIGFMVSGFFVTVLFYPFFWMNLSLTAALHESTRRARREAAAAQAVALAPPPRPAAAWRAPAPAPTAG